MKKSLVYAISTLVLLGVASHVSAGTIAGSQRPGVTVAGNQWFFSQTSVSNPYSSTQCEVNSDRKYYLNGDYNHDGIKDLGTPLYLRDNYMYDGDANNTYRLSMVTAPAGIYAGTTVYTYVPSGAGNMLSVYNGTSSYPISTQGAWYRASKVGPINQPVRAVESEGLLLQVPASRSAADAKFQVTYQLRYAEFRSFGSTSSDYQAITIPSMGYAGATTTADSRYLKSNPSNINNLGPSWPGDYINQSTVISTKAVNWSPEYAHGYECFNATVAWCGDGVVDTIEGEECDLGTKNGQQGSQCTATCTTVPVVQNPDVTIVKSIVGTTTGYQSGNIVTYKLTYRNIGTGLANNVTIKDTLPTSVTYVSSTSNPNLGAPVQSANSLTWTIATLAPGAVGDITIQVKLGSVGVCLPYTNNSIIAATNEPTTLTGNNTSNATFTTKCPEPDVLTYKSVYASSGSYLPGKVVEYTLTYENIGAATANGVIVTDTLPSQVTYVSNSSTSTPNIGQPTIVGQKLTWNVGTLAAGQSGTIKIKVTINADTPTCTNFQVKNNFTVSATNESATLLGNNPSSATFPMQCIDLRSKKTVNKTTVVSGDIVTYSITYGNSGNVTRPGVVTDTLPAGMQYIVNSSTSTPNVGQPTIVGQKLTWNVGNLSAGFVGTISIQAKVIASTPGQQYLNTVCIADDNNYNNNNCGNATSTTTGNINDFDLSINKTPKSKTVTLGEEFDYTLTVRNDGAVPVSGFTVKDYLPAGLDYVSSTPNGIYTASTKTVTRNGLNIGTNGSSFNLIVRVKYVGPGAQTNWTEICNYKGVSSTTSPKDIDSNPCNGTGNNEDDVSSGTVTPTGGNGYIDLSIDKTPKSQVAYSGQTVMFTLTVRNDGTVAANNFAVNDYLPVGLQFVSATPSAIYNATTRTITRNGLSLQPGASTGLTVTAKYLSSSTEVNWTEVCTYNGVSGSNVPKDIDSNPCNGTGNNEDDTSSGKVVSAFIDLNLQKFANGEKAIDVFSGEIVDFSLVVGNSGNATASNFGVNDYLPVGFVFIQSSAGSMYDATTRKITWTGLTLSAGASTTLTFKAQYIDSVERTNYAEVCTYNGLTNNQSGSPIGPKDIDSDPCNRGATPGLEDDESSALVRPRTASNIFDLSINKLIDGVKAKGGAVSGQQVTITLNVTNSGGVGVSNFSVKDYMPVGLDYVESSANPLATYDSGTRIITFTGLNIGPVQTITLTFNAVYRDVVDRINYTEICDYRGTIASGNAAKDIDSNPCNRGSNIAIEDDESSASIGPGGGGGGGPTVDITLNKLVNGAKDYSASAGETVTFTLHATNEGNKTITNASIVDYLPTDVEYVSGSATAGAAPGIVSYDPTTRRLVWSGLTFTNNSAFDLTFKAVYNGVVDRINYAEICAYNGKTIKSGVAGETSDSDSDPCNRGATAGVEDDESSALIKPKTGGCTGNCGGTRNYCGDGLVARPNSYGQYEECDDGSKNGTSASTCSITCKGGGGGGGGSCGNNILEYGEVCDQGPNGGVIVAGRPYAGKTCSKSCSITGVNSPACDYIDPPSIQSDEYLPYWWDLENLQGLKTTCAADGDIIRDSVMCTFTVTDAKGNTIDTYDKLCANSTPDILTKTAYMQVISSLGYNPDDSRIKPYGYDSRKFNFTSLGEHKISVTIKQYQQCVNDGKGGFTILPVLALNKRICEMNFAVTKPYMVSRGPLGNFSSDPLTSFLYMPYGQQVFTTPLPQITQKFDVTQEVKDSIQKLVDTYKKLAVVDPQYTFATFSKVPSKDIYFFEAPTSDGTITISDSQAEARAGRPFTIIVTKGNLVIKGNLAKAKQGMFIVTNGSLRFAMESCNYTQEVNGIFISLNNILSINQRGENAPAHNTDQNQPWCMAGDLTVGGIVIGNDVLNMTQMRRSNVNTWFTELTSINADRQEYLLNHGAFVLKYNPEILDNLPPGAEILAQILNTYKK